MQTTFDIIAIENPAVDIIHTPDKRILETFGGSSTNVIVHLSRLGLRVGLIGSIGDDYYGNLVLRDLEEENVDIQRLRRLHGNTRTWTMKTSPQSYSRLGRKNGVRSRRLTNDDLAYLKSSESLYITLTQSLFGEASAVTNEYGSRLFTNLHGLRQGDTNLPLLSKRDIEILFSNDEESQIARQYISELVTRRKTLVVITKSKDGCEVYQSSHHERYPAFIVNSIDPIGAGDAFSAGFIYGYLKGWELPRICAYANGIGALATTFYGARSRKIGENEVVDLIGKLAH
ncbi:MAG: carbohydrate kinase family protein [Candidatus Aenigmarchaeota archaeon]|nr:carbohydrate kinase family protein [Candidatus Aenigmarchaeota archaeon]